MAQNSEALASLAEGLGSIPSVDMFYRTQDLTPFLLCDLQAHK